MKIKRFIELVAPDKLLSYGSKPQIEKTTGDVVRCEYCNSEGGKYIDSRDPNFDFSKNNGEGYYIACTICKGSGEVQPTITVEWKPAGMIKTVFLNNGKEKITLKVEDLPSLLQNNLPPPEYC